MKQVKSTHYKEENLQPIEKIVLKVHTALKQQTELHQTVQKDFIVRLESLYLQLVQLDNIEPLLVRRVELTVYLVQQGIFVMLKELET